jgi:hypothetical protein
LEAQPPDSPAGLVVHLVHPDRQAAEVLKLFDGSRWPHPAAALTAWKRITRNPQQLGKPLEAVIALFNPEMAREWRVLHEAELHLDLNPADGSPRWYATVPRDDGTAAAALTAMRLSYPEVEPPLKEGATTVPVASLGRGGTPVGCQAGGVVIVGNSAADLLRGLHHLRDGPGTGAGDRSDGGVVFHLDPGRTPLPRQAALPIWAQTQHSCHGGQSSELKPVKMGHRGRVRLPVPLLGISLFDLAIRK